MRILVADKDQAVLSLVMTRLVSRHYEVVTVSESEEVLNLLSRDLFDLILLGTDLERIGGKLLIEEIRSKPHFSSLPIIMMAGEDEISELLLSLERGFDDFLIKPFSPLVLQLRIAVNISRVRAHAEANALTNLPGNVAIERTIRSKIERDEKFSVLYIDINHFKAFNDQYGFERGDDVIRHTARLLVEARERLLPGRECFIGHIGGDDFVVVVSPDDEASYARYFIEEFDRIIPTYYNKSDERRGEIQTTNRRGIPETHPLMSCSVAVCTNLYRPYRSLGEIARDAAEVKSFLKSQKGSHYLRDRRAAPIQHLDQAVDVLSAAMAPRNEGASREPIGKTLVNEGLISEEQLARAIKQHMLTGQKLGQTLLAMDFLSHKDLGDALAKKFDVPYVNLRRRPPSQEALGLFTLDFMKIHRVVPLEIEGQKLKVALCDPLNCQTLASIKRASSLEPVSHLILEDEFEEFMETLP